MVHGRVFGIGHDLVCWSLEMRYVYMAVIVVLAAIVVLFKVQNFDTATVTLFSMSFTMPVSILVLAVYAMGVLTGGSFLALIRHVVRGAKARPH
jgi:lipopolysaccharide assembly protein A